MGRFKTTLYRLKQLHGRRADLVHERVGQVDPVTGEQIRETLTFDLGVVVFLPIRVALKAATDLRLAQHQAAAMYQEAEVIALVDLFNRDEFVLSNGDLIHAEGNQSYRVKQFLDMEVDNMVEVALTKIKHTTEERSYGS